MIRRWMLIYKTSDGKYFDCKTFTHNGIIRLYHKILNNESPESMYVYHWEHGDWEYSFGWCADEIA